MNLGTWCLPLPTCSPLLHSEGREQPLHLPLLPLALPRGCNEVSGESQLKERLLQSSSGSTTARFVRPARDVCSSAAYSKDQVEQRRERPQQFWAIS